MPPKAIYNLETLQAWASRDGATLIGEYENAEDKTEIEFACGNKVENGTCKNRCKRKAYFLAHKIAPMHCTDCLDITEHEKELRKKRDAWEQGHVPKEWYTHPTFSNYEANNEGVVRHKVTKNELKGFMTNEGYIKVGVTSIKQFGKRVHRFVMECLYHIVLSKEYDVDHIDANAQNNHPDNLLIVTKKEHNKKTASTNPGRGKKAAVSKCKAVTCIFPSKNAAIKRLNVDIPTLDTWLNSGKDSQENTWSMDSTNVIGIFESLTQAHKSLNVTKDTISRWIQSGKDSDENRWSYKVNEDDMKDLPGEIWKLFPKSDEYPIENVECSNKGRILDKNRPRPIKIPNWKEYEQLLDDKKNTYCDITIGRNSYKVHQLIALTFHGPPPTSEHTVDHIDRKPSNNCSENLKWATKQEQAENQSTTRPVEVYDPLEPNVVISTHPSMADAGDKYGVHESSIWKVVHLNGRYIFRLKKGMYKELSVRETILTTDQKRERELEILNRQLDVTKNLAKQINCESGLPRHICHDSRGNGSYRLEITFRGKTCYKSNKNIVRLLELKEAWLKEQEEFHRNAILTAFP